MENNDNQLLVFNTLNEMIRCYSIPIELSELDQLSLGWS